MPAFLNKVFKRDHASSKKASDQNSIAAPEPQEVKFQDAWLQTEVTPEQVQELLRGCTQEIKSRGLSTPFLLLPFRPNSDSNAARTFVRNFFNPATGPLRGQYLQQELRLTEPVVLCSTLKWCWSRLPGGVVTWDVYELFRQGEVDSSMARDSFATFIPISAESEARSKIIFDFFDLISAIAAHGKHNGLGGMKLSRLAGWWAFEHSDMGWGFEGGYTSWSRAADATSHLFFAYLRSLSPADGAKGVSVLPISLKALLASIDYPPVTPSQLQTKTVRVVMTVETVSPTPFALLRRARNFQFREDDLALKALVDYDDPIQALTEECKRVLKCISSTNQSSANFKTSTGLQDQSWSRFQDLGFSGLLEESEGSEGEVDGLSMASSDNFRNVRRTSAHPSTPRRNERVLDLARPTTPSWADFMVTGFGERDHGPHQPPPLLLPPDKILPPIDTASRVRSSQSNRKEIEDNLDPGELASVAPLNVDDAFWWVWMSSLAGEESTARKAVFGRCALVETVISGGRWLVVEEKVKGAASATEDVAYLVKEKKKSKRRLMRRKSVGRPEVPVEQPKTFDPSLGLFNRTNIGPDQTAKIQSAAAALRQQQMQQEFSHLRPRDPSQVKATPRTSSMFTLQPLILSEATPALKWANKYDRDTIREAYLKGLPMPEKKEPTRVERPLPPPPQEGREGKSKQEDADPKPERIVQPPPPPSKPTPTTPLPSTPSVARHAPLAVSSPPRDGRASPAFDSRSQNMSVSPKSQPSTKSTPEKSKKLKASRFYNLFSNKKSEPHGGRRASQLEPVSSVSLNVPSRDTSHKPPVNQKKQTTVEVIAEPNRSNSLHPMAVETLPPPPRPEPRRRDSDQPLSQVSSNEERSANRMFSSFDQGPLADQPAFVPDDSTTTSSINEAPLVPEKGLESVSTNSSDPASPLDANPVQDRWAQIRRNAAERVKAAPNASNDFTKGDARGSIDDGETSGEESIESRVARIRARVARVNELTGNVDPAR